MKREEFIEKITEMGINCKRHIMYVDLVCKQAYAEGIYQDNEDWVIYSVDERNNLYEYYRGEENGAFDMFFSDLLVRMYEENYINASITKEIVQISRTVIFDYFRKKYLLEDAELNYAWNYLLYDFTALNNLKYYVVHDSFVPEKDAYEVQGYTAQRIYEETCLNELEAHKYLVNLRLNPEHALSELKGMLRGNKESSDRDAEARTEEFHDPRTKYYKFDKSDGGMRVCGYIYEYLDENGNWVEDSTLINKFVGGDIDYDEITRAEAQKLVENMKNKSKNYSENQGL